MRARHGADDIGARLQHLEIAIQEAQLRFAFFAVHSVHSVLK